MFKKLSTLLLTVLMVCSIFTVNAFADEEQIEPPTEVPSSLLTPAKSKDFEEKAEIVKDSLEAAAKEEGYAATTDVILGNLGDVKDEVAAAANELFAKDAVEVAEIIVDKKLNEIKIDAGLAGIAEKSAFEAAKNAENKLEVIKDEDTKAKEDVEKLVTDVYNEALKATIAENSAEWAYIEAEKDYTVAVIETKIALSAGLVAVEDAAAKTSAIKEDLEQKRDDAAELKSKTDEALSLAEKDVGEAKDKLVAESNKLVESVSQIVENPGQVAQDALKDVGMIAVTEGVLVAADVAVAITNSAVVNLEHKIDVQVNDAKNALKDAKEDIDNLIAKYDANELKRTEKNAVEQLISAKDALEVAEEALNKAEKLKTIKDYRDNSIFATDQAKEVVKEYKNYLENVGICNDETAEDEDKAKALESAVKYVLENVTDIDGEISILDNNLVQVKNTDGTVVFFSLDVENDIKLTSKDYYNATIYVDDDGKYYYKGLLGYKNYIGLDKLTNTNKTLEIEKEIESSSQEKIDAAYHNLSDSEVKYINNLYNVQDKISTFESDYVKLNEALNNEDKNLKDVADEITKLDKDLSGGFVDQLIRAGLSNKSFQEFLKDPSLITAGKVIANGGEDIENVLKENDISLLKPISSGRKLLEAFNNDETKLIGELIAQLSSEEKDVAAIIQNIATLATSNFVSERTKKAFAMLIQDTALTARDAAVDQFNKDTKNLGPQIVELSSAATSYVAKEAAAAKLKMKSAVADASLKRAETLYAAAVDADNAAQKALTDYWNLMLNPNIDRTLVEKAYTSWQNACASADRARDAYKTAQTIYDNVYNIDNHNQGESNGEIKFVGMDDTARYDIVAKDLDADETAKYASLLNVNTSDGRTFLVDAYVVENGNRYVDENGNTALTLDSVVSFSILVPDNIRTVPYLPGTNARVYDVSRWHDDNNDGHLDKDEFVPIATGLTPDADGYLSISSNMFSIYVITARDYHVNYSGYKAVVNTSNK